nr:cytochrome c [Fredinandcohnia sp. SECRCQ15]
MGTTLVFGLAACGGNDDDNASDKGTTDSGGAATASAEDIVKDKGCIACHGGDLSGGAGPDLTKVGSKYSKDEIADIIKNGKGSMQPQNLSDEETSTVATWLSEKK